MASFFGHSVAALSIGYAALGNHPPKRFWVLAVVAGFIPDADVVGFTFGVDYASMLGHRGFTHSILFAILAGALFSLVTLTNHFFKYWLAFFAIILSHDILDAMTSGGLGVGFFVPFSDARYFFPWRPILVSPLSVARFFTERGLLVLKTEALWVGIPALVLIVASYLFRWTSRKLPNS